jgi:predicted permease
MTSWQQASNSSRVWRTAPRLVVAVVATLTLGSSMLLVAFALADATLLRPLPYPQADRLVEIWTADVQAGRQRPGLPDSLVGQLRSERDTVSRVEAYTFDGVTITGPGRADVAAAARVSPGLLQMLGVVPVRGRVFTAEDAQPGHAPVAIVSEAVWNSRYGLTPAILDRGLWLEGTRYRVVGVLPSTFRFPESSTRIWLPLSTADGPRSGVEALAVLASGVPADQADARLRVVSGRWRSSGLLDRNVTLVTAEPLQRRHNRRFSTGLYGILFGAGLLHLVACLNVANLFLGRQRARERELAVRAALGAHSADLAWSAVREGALLCLAGWAGGVALAHVGVRLLVGFNPSEYTWLAASDPSMNARVLLFGAGAALVTIAVATAVPALRAFRIDVATSLRRGSPTHTAAGSQLLNGALVAIQLSVALVVVSSGGLLLNAFARLVAVVPGLLVSNLIVLEEKFPDSSTEAARRAFTDRLSRRVELMPHVVRVAWSAGAPPSGGAISFDALPEADEGRAIPGLSKTEIGTPDVGPGYFEATGIKLLAGRGFHPDDPPDTIVVSQSLAGSVWGNRSPVGHRFRLDAGRPWSEVIGVAEDVRLGRAGRPMANGFDVYARRSPGAPGFCTMLVRTDSEEAVPLVIREVSNTFMETDPQLPLLSAGSMRTRLRESWSQQRFLMVAASVVAGVTLALAFVGVVATAGYWAASRRRELAIRLAVGCEPAGIVGLLLRRAVRIGVVGATCGVLLALACNRLLGSVLFEITPTDIPTYAAAVGLLWLIVLGAAYVPARRASLADPLATLREG